MKQRRERRGGRMVAPMPATVTAICLLLFAGCDHAEPPGNTTDFLVEAVTADAHRDQPYVVFIPHDHDPAEKLPVILFLNGWGQNGDDGLRQVSNNFGQDVWRRRNQMPFLAVCPQCSKEGYWAPGNPDGEFALACLDAAIAKYGGDPERVYVTGTSSGGAGAIQFASAYPDRFAAVLQVSSGYSGDVERLAESQMPIWAIVNRNDGQDWVRSIRESRPKWLEAGLSPIVIEADRMTGNQHNAWDEAYGPTVAYEWLLEQRLSRNETLTSFELLSSKDLLARWEDRGSAQWSVNEQDELFGAAEKRRGLLLSPEIPDNAECHLDVFLKPAQRLRLGVLPAGAAESELTEIILELPEAGTGGIRSAKGEWLASLDPAAQQALYRGWNDVRLERQGGRITLRLNGWPAARLDDPAKGQSLQWALIASPREPVRVRYLRQCEHLQSTEATEA